MIDASCFVSFNAPLDAFDELEVRFKHVSGVQFMRLFDHLGAYHIAENEQTVCSVYALDARTFRRIRTVGGNDDERIEEKVLVDRQTQPRWPFSITHSRELPLTEIPANAKHALTRLRNRHRFTREHVSIDLTVVRMDNVEQTLTPLGYEIEVELLEKGGAPVHGYIASIVSELLGVMYLGSLDMVPTNEEHAQVHSHVIHDHRLKQVVVRPTGEPIAGLLVSKKLDGVRMILLIMSSKDALASRGNWPDAVTIGATVTRRF